MVLDKIKELAALREKTATLEEQISAERNKELLALPAQFGFDSMDSFFAALRTATGKKLGRPAGKAPGSASGQGKKIRRRRRATITDETRAEVKKMVGNGKSGSEIAKTLGISLPSVQNIKKALGLVKERKK